MEKCLKVLSKIQENNALAFLAKAFQRLWKAFRWKRRYFVPSYFGRPLRLNVLHFVHKCVRRMTIFWMISIHMSSFVWFRSTVFEVSWISRYSKILFQGFYIIRYLLCIHLFKLKISRTEEINRSTVKCIFHHSERLFDDDNVILRLLYTLNYWYRLNECYLQNIS